MNITAELTATVLTVEVSEGDTVHAGDTLVVLESMKMEIPVEAETSGSVLHIAVETGTSVQEGNLLMVIES